jgi:hypothetical protein
VASSVRFENYVADTPVTPGENAHCTITYTVFFDGCSTLNRFTVFLLGLLVPGFGLFVQRRI